MLKLNFKKMNGLIPVIVQDHEKGDVLMMAFMNEEAWKKTLESGKAWYYSRTREKLWLKGEKSGNIQIVREIFVDCDDDTILLKVEQVGQAACHTGYRSCFYRKLNGDLKVVGEKIFDPEEVYKEKE